MTWLFKGLLFKSQTYMAQSEVYDVREGTNEVVVIMKPGGGLNTYVTWSIAEVEENFRKGIYIEINPKPNVDHLFDLR